MAKIGIDAYIDVKLFTNPTIRASLSQLFLQRLKYRLSIMYIILKSKIKLAVSDENALTSEDYNWKKQ